MGNGGASQGGEDNGGGTARLRLGCAFEDYERLNRKAAGEGPVMAGQTPWRSLMCATDKEQPPLVR